MKEEKVKIETLNKEVEEDKKNIVNYKKINKILNVNLIFQKNTKTSWIYEIDLTFR